MLLTVTADPPEGRQWQHEIKYDGYRTQITINGSSVQAFTRNGHDWTHHYAPVVKAARGLDCRSAIIDGEMVVQGEDGRSDFHALRRAIGSSPDRLVFYAFDLLHLGGRDLRKLPLEARRACLESLVGDHDPSWPIQFSSHVIGDGRGMFEVAEKMGLEGIVSKKVGSRYISGRSTSWFKVKCLAEDEFVIVGTEQGVGPTTALLARETDAGLEYVGGAMLTLPDDQREWFWAKAEGLVVPKAPLKLEKRKAARWLRPEMKARVRYLKGSDKLRHATVMQVA